MRVMCLSCGYVGIVGFIDNLELNSFYECPECQASGNLVHVDSIEKENIMAKFPEAVTGDECRVVKGVLDDIVQRSKKTVSDEEYTFPQTKYDDRTLRVLESFVEKIPFGVVS